MEEITIVYGEYLMNNLSLCPSCGKEIEMNDNVFIGEHNTCPGCGASLEVTNVKPLQIDERHMEDELSDWIDPVDGYHTKI